MFRGHLSSIWVAFYSLLIISFIGIPSSHAEVGIDLLPNALEPLDYFDVVAKHFLAYLVQTYTLTYVDHRPEQMLIGAFEFVAKMVRIRVYLAGNQEQSLLELTGHTG